MTSSLPEFRFDTEELPPQHRFAVWREGVSAMFDAALLPETDPSEFSASGTRWNLGPIVVTDGRVTGHFMSRSVQQARTDGVDRYALIVLRRGTWHGDFGAGIRTIRRGTPYLLDFARPLWARSTDNAYIMVHMSREVLEDLLPPAFEGHGSPLHGVGATLLIEHLTSLIRHLPKLSPAEALHLAHATCDMIAACLVPTEVPAHGRRTAVERALIHHAKRYIDLNLHNADLSHEQLCQVLGISRATLYRVFKPLGGVVDYIQGRRLARIHELLTSNKEHRRLSEIAAQYGFVSLPHFSRTFRRHFGYSASQALAHAKRLDPEGSGSISDRYHRWVRKHDR